MSNNSRPRLVAEQEAAASVGLELSTFRSWVATGKLPKPLPDCGKYDLRAIDLALDRLSGIGSPQNALDAWRAKGNRSAR
jgi:hypothetical protein